jgi:hypothetical protein
LKRGTNSPDEEKRTLAPVAPSVCACQHVAKRTPLVTSMRLHVHKRAAPASCSLPAPTASTKPALFAISCEGLAAGCWLMKKRLLTPTNLRTVFRLLISEFVRSADARAIADFRLATPSDCEGRVAGREQVQVHFDEIILYAASFCGPKSFFQSTTPCPTRTVFFSAVDQPETWSAIKRRDIS